MNITKNTIVPRLAMGQQAPSGAPPSLTGQVLSIPSGSGPNGGTFGGIRVNTRFTAVKNQSTLFHARKPINFTYLVDLDQSTIVPLRHKQRHPDSMGAPQDERDENESTVVTNGEMNKQDICVLKRISTSSIGIAYAVKNIGSFNMYMRTTEARSLYGSQRHCGRLIDDWDLHGMIQVGNVYRKNFGRYTAYSLEFSVADYGVVTDVWKACQLQPWHTFTKHTANEGDYIGFVLIRLRYERTAVQMASTKPSSKKKRRITSSNDNLSTNDDPLTDPTYAHLPAYKRYNAKEYAEEFDNEHFWQLVPYISSLASGPYQDFLENQHFTGRVFPMGQIWETYDDKIKPNTTDARHALYYLFPWLESADGPWRERMLDHRNGIKSNLTINFKVNSHKLYII